MTTKSPSDQIMIGKYQIVENIPKLDYNVYYKDFGLVYRADSVVDAIRWALQDWNPETLQEYRSA